MSLITGINLENLHIYKFLFDKAETRHPNLSFIFIDDNDSQNTRMPVSTDSFGGIVTMDNLVPGKSKPHDLVSNSYCIAIKFCKFLHYKTNTIIDTMFELYELDPNFVNAFVFFVDGVNSINNPFEAEDKEGIKMISRQTNGVIPFSIEAFISICPYSLFELGYYIPPENYDYIHIFKKGTNKYAKGIINYNFVDLTDRYNSIISSEPWLVLKNEISACKFEQTKNIEITHFILYLLMDLFFNKI